jgi:N-acyl-D-aspartate/D-glutamate deacylase
MKLRLAIASALAVIVASVPVTSQPDVVAFTGMRVIDGTGAPPIENATLVVENGRITAVGPSASTPVPAGTTPTTLGGKTIIPGLINAHGHVNDIDRVLPLYASYGVTTVLSLGNDNNAAQAVATRDRQATARLPRARLFTAGAVVAADTPPAARAQVAANADLRVDLIKIRI